MNFEVISIEGNVSGNLSCKVLAINGDEKW